MSYVAIKMLFGARAELFGLVFPIAFALGLTRLAAQSAAHQESGK